MGSPAVSSFGIFISIKQPIVVRVIVQGISGEGWICIGNKNITRVRVTLRRTFFCAVLEPIKVSIRVARVYRPIIEHTVLVGFRQDITTATMKIVYLLTPFFQLCNVFMSRLNYI